MAGLAQLTEEEAQDYINSSGPELRREFPKLYGFLGGLLGTAPDQFAGSVLDPKSKDVRKGAEYGFPIGVGAAVAPFAGGIAAAKGLATGGKAAQQGLLRLGGRNDLIASHHTSASRLLNADGELLPELNHLSLAVTRNTIPNIMPGSVLDQSVILIPRAGKFDPRTSPSVLHSRDAWTQRYNESIANNLLARNPDIAINKLAQARLADRYQTRWPKGGAGAEVGGEPVVGNVRFNSFKGYENSPQSGIEALGKKTTPEAADAWTMLQAEADDMGIPAGELLQEIMQGPEQMFRGVDKFKLYQTLRNAPRPYAELKNFGRTQLTGDTFAAAMLRPESAKMSTADTMYRQALAEQLYQRGIPVVPRALSGIANFQRASQLQRTAR